MRGNHNLFTFNIFSIQLFRLVRFNFQVKLVDVEKVEWLNRRSYSAISLFLGREGRVLLRAEHGLEDWFELLEVMTAFSLYLSFANVYVSIDRNVL